MVDVQYEVVRSRFNATYLEREEELELQGLDADHVDVDGIVTAMRNYLQDIRNREPPEAWIRLTFYTLEALENESYSDMSTRFVRVRDLNMMQILHVFERYLQYRVRDHHEMGLDWSQLALVTLTFQPPDAREPVGLFEKNISDAMKKYRSIKQIRNKDRLCVLRAVAYVMGYTKNSVNTIQTQALLQSFNDDDARDIRMYGMNVEHRAVLCQNMGFVLHEVKFFAPGNGENVQDTNGCTQFYVSNSYYPNHVSIKTKAFFILLDGDHAHAITKHTQLLGGPQCAWFCHLCVNVKRSSKKRDRYCEDDDWYYHRCDKLSDPDEQLKQCDQCGRKHYLSYTCKRSKQDALKDRKEIQTLSENPIHFHMETLPKKDDFKRLENIIFYDFETYIHPETHRHTVTHVAATFYEFDSLQSSVPGKKILADFEHAFSPFPEEEQSLVDECGDNTLPFYLHMEGGNCLEQFADFLTQLHLCRKDFSLFAHNGSRFDNIILFNKLIEYAKPSDIILNGTRMMQCKFKQLKCILRDTYLILPFPLGKFAKTFELKKSKDYYPYDLHTPENLWNHPEGIEFPSLEHFNIKRLPNKKSQDDLRAWYAQQPVNEPYHMNLVCRAYCLRDVLVLHAGTHKFRTTTMESKEIDPLTKVTTPSLAFSLFRRDFLEEDLLLDVSRAPLFQNKVITQHCSEWVHHELSAMEGPFQIETLPSTSLTLEGLPYSFSPHAIDHHTKTIFIFADEYQVRRPSTYQPDGKLHASKCGALTNGDVFHLFERILQSLKSTFSDYDVRVQYEQQWVKEKKRKHYKIQPTLPILLPSLQAKQSYFGGRVEPWMYYVHKDCTIRPSQIAKIDVVSLYPSVMLNNRYPVGSGVRYHQHEVHEIDLMDVFGFIQCSVYVPETELYPILPHQCAGKLMFPCGIFSGVFTSVELQHAITHGNVRVLKTYDILHFPNTRTDLFTEFIKSCIRGKMEASGIPAGKTLDEYVQDAKEKSGVEMDPSKVKKNDVLRLLCKLMVNSFYGKFAESSHPKTQMLFSHEQLWSVLEKEVNELSFVDVGQSQKYCSYKEVDDVGFAPNTNVYIATFVTSYARLVLWDAISKIVHCGGVPIYGDTDSVVYLHFEKSMNDVIPAGVQVGEWEVECEDNIVEVVVNGPKAYSCKLSSGVVDTHFKGVTRHVENQHRLGHDVMIDLVQERVQCVCVDDFRLVVNYSDLRGPHFPHNYQQSKSVKMSEDKRQKVKHMDVVDVDCDEVKSDMVMYSIPNILFEDEFGGDLQDDHAFLSEFTSSRKRTFDDTMRNLVWLQEKMIADQRAVLKRTVVSLFKVQ